MTLCLFLPSSSLQFLNQQREMWNSTNVETVVVNQTALQEHIRPKFPTEDVFHKTQTTLPVVFNQSALQERRSMFPVEELFHKEQTTLLNNTKSVVINETAFLYQDRPTHPTEELSFNEQRTLENEAEPVVFNHSALQERHLDRHTLLTEDLLHKEHMNARPVVLNQTASQKRNRPTFPNEELFNKEQITFDNNVGPFVFNQTALQEQDKQTFTLLEEKHTEPTSTRIPYSSTMNHVFRNSSRSAYTTHSYVKMLSENAHLDKLESGKLLENNKEYVCFVVKGHNQENTTIKGIECAVPKAFQTSRSALLSFCKIPLKEWIVLGILTGSCNVLKTKVLEKINRLIKNGQLFTIENSTVVAFKVVCLTRKKNVGTVHFVNMCLIKEGLIPPSDHLRISQYLEKACNIPEAVITKSNVKFVDTLSQCSEFVHPRENSDDFTHAKYRQYIGFLTVLILSIIGILANSVAIGVLANGGLETTKRSKSTTYFILLLFNGLLLLVSSLLMTLVVLKFMNPLPFGWCHLTYILRYFAFFGSTYCILLVTIERYIVICHPLRAKLILTESFQRMVSPIF